MVLLFAFFDGSSAVTGWSTHFGEQAFVVTAARRACQDLPAAKPIQFTRIFGVILAN
jgi:hypothetical protein